MARSAKKGPYVDEKLMKKVTALAHDDKTVIKTWARSSEIAPDMIGRIFGVHNGKDFIQVRVTEEMVGHRLGEFSPTKKFIRHGGKLAKEADRKAAQKK
ncbi:30S ribosomal protein S19 [Candidatus Wolfebacteria bacterium RIFOXYB2_FULL_49_7]|uniref:Small ribosomal subunit protein uS19 n=2 Tax=Candidatus Wolfeibacteriota TaxID=1752735 RepID=A0A1F8DWD3_9BACT|nr:MAG: 30S ribosomal protein S19 [Candidatus Wolfebacteria bacterium RIFOXYB1_FULL_54_12]OGM95295.1 MAG: 30S ribosomal protein S19 [Candidatus Wolfebacteria bacterium RIFOXYD12_FULL_48_21]OGM95358.1 MAG: 30S ribosomal protein S19 [Candidatus Wolfebacteria bacterium RIFOXYB2_FULL_49_7]OGM95631.1 MAG: 30S ribosomal protein S19 [Candidatus Wolfebacteria bacterium RIFOXYD1_FULL_48_65]OGM96733.1 MAG: 30S ribosomal protein S19 [Candidatus Wolfebacteria bacterium RIFOXYD2_FULL_48_11]